jgi:hypothetical protein
MDDIMRRLMEQQSLQDRLLLSADPLRLHSARSLYDQVEKIAQRDRDMLRIASESIADRHLQDLIKPTHGLQDPLLGGLDPRLLELGVTGRFALPDVGELHRLAEQAFGVGPYAHSAKQIASGAYQRLEDAAMAIRSPWIDQLNAIGSVQGLLGLQSVRDVIASDRPFSDRAADILRESLGDWREPIVWPKDVFDDLRARSAFYEARGFDPLLTAYPSPAFHEGLSALGLSEHSSEDTVDDEEVAGLERVKAAHSRLVRFERSVRRFIHLRMSAAYGDKWIKQRVPGPIWQDWADKQERARSQGRPVETLIDYAEFGDYVQIITRTDNWEAVFKGVFVRPSSVIESFQRLYPLRNDTMHSRMISQDDELFLLAETRRIQRAIETDDD